MARSELQAEVRSMTYMLYHVLRRLPRPMLVGLMILFLTTLARA